MGVLVTKNGCLPYNPDLQKRSRELRNNLTNAEKKIWFNFLRKHLFTFHRQKIIDNFIVDFYCSKLLLVIEIDGETHYGEENEFYDQKRTLVLNEYGIEVIRFTNNDIFENFEGVCLSINSTIQRIIEEKPPAPL